MALLASQTDFHLRSSRAMGQLASAPFSICVWLKMNWSDGKTKVPVGIYGPETDTPLLAPTVGVQIGTKDGKGELSFRNLGSNIVETADKFMEQYNDQWVFIAFTNDGIMNRCYVNDAEVLTSAIRLSGYLNQIFINGYPGGGNKSTGEFQLDALSFYNRALSIGEITTIYNVKGSSHGIFYGLKAKYEFDELAENMPAFLVPDVSGNSNFLSYSGSGNPLTYVYTDALVTNNIRTVQ